MEDRLSITNKTKGKVPTLPLLAIKDEILGKGYVLSIALVDPKTSKSINYKYRGKNKSTNILSFSLSKKEGELILCPSVIKKQAPEFDKSYPDFFGFLVIHGMLHLKGFSHGSIMERLEQKYDKKYFYRDRHRILHDSSRGGRVHQRRKNS